MDRLKLDHCQLPPGSALAVDSTTTDTSALTSTLTPLGSEVSTNLDTSDGSALANPVNVDVTLVGSALNGSALAEDVTSGNPLDGSALVLSDNETDMTDGQATVKRIPGVTEPYRHVGTREKLEKELVWFTLHPNAIALSRLHLCSGVYCSDLAKRRGLLHGLCDERGMNAEPEVATHVGFTAGDEEEMED